MLLDDRDRRLLTLLQEDCARSLTDLAAVVHLSVSACARRIQRLREGGLIAREVAVLDRDKAGLPTTVFVLIRSGRHSMDWLEHFRRAVGDIPEIVEVHRLTGNADYIAKIVLPTVEHYDVIYKQLISRIELFDVSAYISMERIKDSPILPTGHAGRMRPSPEKT